MVESADLIVSSSVMATKKKVSTRDSCTIPLKANQKLKIADATREMPRNEPSWRSWESQLQGEGEKHWCWQ